MRYLIGTLGKSTSNLAQILPIPGENDAPQSYLSAGYDSDVPPTPTGGQETSSDTLTVGTTFRTGSHLAGYALNAVGMWCDERPNGDPQWLAAIYEITGAHTATLVTKTIIDEIATEQGWNTTGNFPGADILKPLTNYVVAVQNRTSDVVLLKTAGAANAFSTFASSYSDFPDPSAWSAGGHYGLYVFVTAA